MKVEIVIGFSLLLSVAVIVGRVHADDDFPPTEAPQTASSLASNANSLGFNILKKKLVEDPDKNVVLSPAGLSGLLGITMLGTVGKTYNELSQALGFSLDIQVNRQSHETFGKLLKDLNSHFTSSKTTYADAIFIDKNSKIRDSYKKFINLVYNGEALSVDFGSKEETQSKINQWVNDNTNGKISDFLKDPLSADTKAALVSAVYFNGQWAKPFIPEYTLRMPFKRPKDEIEADLMLNLGEFKYISKNNIQMIALPYNDNETVLYALKPFRPNKESLPELLNNLDYEKINELIDELTLQKCVVRFPKMDIKFFANLKDALKELGVHSLFKPDEANFALLIDNGNDTETLKRLSDENYARSISFESFADSLLNPHVFVDSIIHDVRIKIDEAGTEAVAASSGIIARTANSFYANSPFYMFIRNEKTKLVTFSAAIFDPTA